MKRIRNKGSDRSSDQYGQACFSDDSVVSRLLMVIRGRAKHTAAWVSFFMCVGLTPVQAGFTDPLDIPAVTMPDVAHRAIHAVARAGDRLVAVGPRGLIMTSENQGEVWKQSPVPVQSDLVAVHFPTAQSGWAVGHDGVVLHSADGGFTWEKQLDGRQAKALFTDYYNARIEKGDAQAETGLQRVEMNYVTGPSLPLLSVWFEDEQRGYAVGAFGLLISTRDGGRSWQPWLERIENEEQLHLNSIRSIAGDLYIAAERGTLFRLDRASQHFDLIETSYGGSFFGLAGTADMLLAFGLEGSVYRSLDRGENWTRLETDTNASVTGASQLPDSDRYVLTTAVGELLIGDASSPTLSLERPRRPSRFTGVTSLAGGQLLISSLEGMRRLSLEE